MKLEQFVGKAIAICLVMSGICQGAVNVSVAWNPSLTDVNGQTLENAVTYKLFYSDSSGVYSEYVDAGASAQAAVTGLEYNKTYFFKAKAYTETGESVYSTELTWNAPVMLDTDTDGLSDNWELANFQSLDLSQSSTDNDGDGTLDVDEFVAGTSPVDSNDCPVITLSGATLSFLARQAEGEGYENRTRSYRVMQCEDLQSDNWIPVPGMEAISAVGQVVNYDLSASGQQGYYRTQIQLN